MAQLKPHTASGPKLPFPLHFHYEGHWDAPSSQLSDVASIWRGVSPPRCELTRPSERGGLPLQGEVPKVGWLGRAREHREVGSQSQGCKEWWSLC